MKLNHLNLPVPDVNSARDFFIGHLNFYSLDVKTNDTIAVLRNNDNFTLVLMHNKLNEQGNSTYPDAFHIGFFLENEHAVNAFFEKLKLRGIILPQEPQRIRRTYGFYFHHQNIMIEVAVMG